MPEGTDFLYPFIEGDERDAGPLLLDLARSAVGKHEVSVALRTATLSAAGSTLNATSRAMADAFAAGGGLFSFGNGGSATDAASLAALFSRPPSGRALPARSLADDPACLLYTSPSPRRGSAVRPRTSPSLPRRSRRDRP